MIATTVSAGSGPSRFRIKLFAAMMVVISAMTAFAFYLAQRQLAVNAEQELQREFQGEIDSLHRVQEMYRATLAESCRVLAQKPRIHAALEDNALDLLYPNAKDELRDLMRRKENRPEKAEKPLQATFCRFLNGHGAVIAPPNVTDVGELTPEEEAQLQLPMVPAEQQIGYLLRKPNGQGETIDEVVAMPIISTETGQSIAAIVVGVKPVELGRNRTASTIMSGIWVNDRLYLPSFTDTEQTRILGRVVTRAIAPLDRPEKSIRVKVKGVPHLLFYKQLNPNSLFSPAYEICIYSLEDLLARQRQVRWQIIGAGVVLLLAAFGVSHFAAARLSAPVSKLEHDSAENLAELVRTEAALEKTSQELERSARFSANTSHQLKTPVTVLRAGLEELRTHENLTAEGREEVAALIHQTFRITSIIEDLLLLSQMDAGHLRIAFSSVDLSHLLAAQLDDLSALPEDMGLDVESDCVDVQISGEKHYVALILQNLLENARKYNRPEGRIRISCREKGNWAIITVGNTGRTIPPSAREHIFERFHRGAVGEEITGHGLGLNLARELARLHGGDLRLVTSENDWTEFEVRFHLARQAVGAASGVS